MHSARGDGHGAHVLREAILHHGLHRFAYCENRMCNLGRMSSLEFEDSVPVKAKVGLPHRWWNAVKHITTFIFAFVVRLFCLQQVKMRRHFLATAKSSWLFDGPWAWLFLADCTVWGLVQQTRGSGLHGFLSRPSETERERQRFLVPVPSGMDRNLWLKVCSLNDEDSSSFGSTCQRTAWGLFQILVSSSTTDFIQTEQWLHHYDTFVRNGFENYLWVMQDHLQFSLGRLAHPRG